MSATPVANSPQGIGAGSPVNFQQNNDQPNTGKMPDGISVSRANPPVESPNLLEQTSNFTQRTFSGSLQEAQRLFGGLRSTRDKANDGLLFGANGRSYPPNTPLNNIEGVRPDNGREATGRTAIYVNGIMTDAAAQQATMQRIANQTGANVIGIHNSTGGFAADIAQSARDKLNNGNNPPVNTLSNAIYDSISNRQDINVIAHSQGGLIASRAVRDASQRLRREGFSDRQVQDMMRQYVNVQTFGSAAGHYPDGPNYRHVMNVKDIVPGLFGLTGDTPLNTPIFHAGRDARVERFNSTLSPTNITGNHSIDDLYMRYVDPNYIE
jgi:hypothetical protein